MRIRLASTDDLPAILAISNAGIDRSPANFAVLPESLPEWEKSFADTREFHPWLVVDAGGVIGFARASRWKARGAYNWTAEVSVYVQPDLHRRGFGRALYARLFEIMRAQGWRTLLAGVVMPNEASVRLHESFGFTKVALLPRVGYKLGAWWDVGYWALDLEPTNKRPETLRPVSEAIPDYGRMIDH